MDIKKRLQFVLMVLPTLLLIQLFLILFLAKFFYFIIQRFKIEELSKLSSNEIFGTLVIISCFHLLFFENKIISKRKSDKLKDMSVKDIFLDQLSGLILIAIVISVFWLSVRVFF